MAENRPAPYGGTGQSLSLRGAMDRLLQDAFVPSPAGAEFWPAIDIRITDDAYVLDAALPGVKPDDVQITVENQTISIWGEVRDDSELEQGEYLHRERKVGRFSRQVGFPTRVDADGAEATFADGTLRLRVPKAQETQPHRIEIKG
jgi:HSP20 family protein